MSSSNILALSAVPGDANAFSSAIDSSAGMKISAQLISSGPDAMGDLEIQASNDPSSPINWDSIEKVSFKGAGSVLSHEHDISYQWVRVAYLAKSNLANFGSFSNQSQFIGFSYPNSNPVTGSFLCNANGRVFGVNYGDTAATFQAALNACPGYEAVTVVGDFVSGFTLDFVGTGSNTIFLDISDNVLYTSDPIPVDMNFTFTPYTFHFTNPLNPGLISVNLKSLT